MFHTSEELWKPVFQKISLLVALLAVVASTGFLSSSQANAAENAMNMISAVQAQSSGSEKTIRIMTDSEPAYTVYELFNPSRIVVDIANASVANESNISLPQSLPVSLSTTEISDTDPALTRLEFTFDNAYTSYDVETQNNDILLTVVMENSGPSESAAGTADQVSTMIADKKNIDSQLPELSMDTNGSADTTKEEEKSTAESLRRSFNFGGYDKTRISVDFYKIDLHNVFRLFREVSNVNIVVDEAVSGSLTLALNDVPWDFALDIILNLKDLQKEERFNTIVILPKNKEFSWPERAEDNLNFEADENVAVKEAIVIQQQLNLPPEIVAAKKLIQKGKQAEKKGNILDAISLYSEAFAKWPDNGRLANKIATIYLVQLGQNARAVHYAKQALAIDNSNAGAALNAAIGLANMHEYKDAQEYFDQSVSVPKPSREALLSYAVFSEEQGQFEAALTLLDKYRTLYGANLDSMVAYARILDKQGKQDAATEKYKSILLSGFQIPPDLRKYINSRIALNQ